MGPATAELYGPARTVIMSPSADRFRLRAEHADRVADHLPGVPLIGGGSLTVGASASIAGLIGAIFHYGQPRRQLDGPELRVAVQIIAMVFYAFCSRASTTRHMPAGLPGAISSHACSTHCSPERVDHIVIALAAIAASLLSVVASVFSILRLS